jgi:multiple sugar transport system ATP-binding protein
MVFQDYALYPHKNVYENIAFGLRIRPMDQSEIDRRVREAAAKLDLTAYLQRKPSALSGGQRQRVAIGRAIVRKPDVFLFDEPLSNLDAKLRGSMRVTISKLHKELNATILYVTHDQVEAMTLADRIIVLEGGRIQQMGPPLQLYYHPINKFVAEFIGSPAMNMISGRLVFDQGLSFVSDQGSIRFKISEPHLVKLNERAKPDLKVSWGVRAENFRVADPGTGMFEAKVLVTEPLGAHTNVICDIAGHETHISLPEPHRPKFGDKISLNWQSKHFYLFDEATGLSLEKPKSV